MTESLETQTLQDRLNCLQELTDFTEKCNKQLNELFEALGWTQDRDKVGSAQEEMEQCPYDPNHRVPVRSMERHKASCQLSQTGYSREEQAEICDPSVWYEKANVCSFTMDKNTQHQVILQARASAPLMRMEGVFWQGEYSSRPPEVPQNHKRALCDLTVADRLALYDHVTRVTSQQRSQAGSTNNEDLYIDLVAKLKRGEEQNTPKSHLELMAEMRDYKRRRQSYRAKNVHITKKSYTEVIREVIDVHSGELARQWREEEEEEEEEAAARAATHSSSHRRRSDDGRSASTESRHSHFSSREAFSSHSKRHRSREHSRERSQGKESKKKRKRDSRSPDNRHHDRKKKKKKKKEEKEKRYLRISTSADGPDEVITTSK